MNRVDTRIPDLAIIEPHVFGGECGFFFESFNARELAPLIGEWGFVQDNHSRSARGVLRGLHYQIRQPQGKLVRVVAGSVLDVALDIRQSSPTFGQHEAVQLSSDNKRILWIPPGFAHGFLVLSEHADLLYKTTDYWAPEYERCIFWNDPALGIDWRLDRAPTLSAKDAQGMLLSDADVFA